MLTAAAIRLAHVRRSPAIWMMIAVPILLAEVLTEALAPVIDADDPYRITVVAFGLLFAFYGASEMADSIFHERVARNWPRLLASATPASHQLAGKLVGTVVQVCFQLGVVLLYGWAVRDVGIADPAQAAVMVLLAATSASVLGIVPGTLIGSQGGLNQLSNALAIGLAAIGGAIAPRESLPGVLEAIAPITPHHHLLKGFDNATAGGPWADLIGPIVYLVAFTAVAFAIGLWVFTRNTPRLIAEV